MSSWTKLTLGEISDSCLGKMLDQEKNKGSLQPYLANLNVRWGGFSLESLQKMRFEDNEQERYGLVYGDLVICEGGEPGRCAIWRNQMPNMKIQKALHRLRVKPGFSADFCIIECYLLMAN
jgi:type I restriction enzyme S subunit